MNEAIKKGLSEQIVPVFHIERFAIHDGPGIRTTVFLKGCPLRCLWCANPESRTAKPGLMRLDAKCTGCGACIPVCPENAIENVNGRIRIDRGKCTGCGECVGVCPNGCMRIAGKRMTLREISDILIKDRDYYESTGGGVTFSGGEALLHFKELMPLLAFLREQGISTAFETCGQVASSSFREAAKEAALFLFDVKSADPERLQRFTGGDLRLILENLRFLAEYFPEKVIVRIPVIPGFNLEDDGISSIFRLLAELSLKRAELLAYHTLGRTKYEQLGEAYPYAEKALDRKELLPLCEAGKRMGLEVTC